MIQDPHLIRSNPLHGKLGLDARLPETGIEGGIDPLLDGVPSPGAVHDPNGGIDLTRPTRLDERLEGVALLAGIAHPDADHPDQSVYRRHAGLTVVDEPQREALVASRGLRSIIPPVDRERGRNVPAGGKIGVVRERRTAVAAPRHEGEKHWGGPEPRSSGGSGDSGSRPPESAQAHRFWRPLPGFSSSQTRHGPPPIFGC